MTQISKIDAEEFTAAVLKRPGRLKNLRKSLKSAQSACRLVPVTAR